MFDFYDVKSRTKVALGVDQVTKTTYHTTSKTGKTIVRYALRGNHDSRNLTKFVNATDWQNAAVKEV